MNQIIADDKNHIWIATDKGILKLGSDLQVELLFDNTIGIKNDRINNILIVKNTLWATNLNSLIKINIETSELDYIYNSYDGLKCTEFLSGSMFKLADNSIIIKDIHDYLHFHPDSITHKKKNYKLSLTQLDIFDSKTGKEKHLTHENLNTIKQLNLDYTKNYLSMKFDIGNIINSDRNSFKYRIKKLENIWKDIPNGNLYLKNLPPDTYELEIIGYSANGESTNALNFNLKIEKVFYKRKIFIVLMVIFILVLTFYKLYNSSSLLKKEYTQEIKHLKLKAKLLQLQMNPHFIFNTLGGIESLVVKKEEKEANRYIGILTGLMRKTLDLCNKDLITIGQEIEYL